MSKNFIVLGLVSCLSFLLLPNISYADTAEVLPRGIHSVSLEGQFYQPIDEKFDPDGNEEPLAADFNSTLDRNIFDQLGTLEDFFNANFPGSLPGGKATLGESVVSLEYDVTILDFLYTYGLWDRLMIGIRVPYWDFTSDVDARVDTTNATVGFNPGPGPPLIPVSLGGIKNDALATELTQQSLVNLGYKRVETWSDSGIGDIEAGARYQYYKSENWRLAFTGAVRFPTGQEDDPDNLVDFRFGRGAWALLFQFQNDYIGTDNLVLNGTFRYDLYLPDTKVMRIPDDVNQPITSNREKVDRDIGDFIEWEVAGTYSFWDAFSLSLLYRFTYKMKDEISGNLGFAYDQAEAETRRRSHIGKVGLSYSTIPLVQAKKFPIPLRVTLSYRSRFAGKNILQSDYIGLLLAVFF
jgi:hypothetical protein